MFKLRDLTKVGLLLLVTVACFPNSNIGLFVSGFGANLIKEFKDLIAVANKIESSSFSSKSRQQSKNIAKEYSDLLYVFARESKRAYCSQYHDQVIDKMSEFNVKATQYMEENNSGGKSWFNGMFGGPLVGMKNVAKFDPFLADLCSRYETLAKKKSLKPERIECDMHRFHVKSLHSILFVLETDFKNLLNGDQAIQNRAIYEQLKADKMVSKVNYYEVDQLTGEQRDILLHYIASKSKSEETSVGKAVDHFYNPGEYIIGRLLDTCQTVLRYEQEWPVHKELENHCTEIPAEASSSLFGRLYKSDKFDETFNFCHALFNAL